MEVKTKKCKVCEKEFKQWSTTQQVCSPICAVKLAKQKEKAKEDSFKALKEKVKPRAQWVKEAQAAFNSYIRIRDDHQACISCGRHHQGQYHAGHFYTTKARPDIRFNAYNNHKQCAPCNVHLSGNLLPYRDNLIKKIGLERVEALAVERAYKSDIEYLKRIKSIFTRKAKLYKKRFR